MSEASKGQRAHLRERLESLGAAETAANEQRLLLPRDLENAVADARTRWAEQSSLDRLFEHDSALWTGADEDRWLGWLRTPVSISEQELADLESLAAERSGPESRVVLLGMGGSSLGPEVLASTLASNRPLHVLDTTDSAQIRRVQDLLVWEETLFIVSSKSGSTLETRMLFDYFFEALTSRGVAAPGEQFVVVTDSGSKLEELARERGVSRVFPGVPSIGGRYSVLSNFGLVPAAAVGCSAERLMAASRTMAWACTAEVDQTQNPALELGLVLGLASQVGRDKVTFSATDGVRGFGAWAEQLLAESTGKLGRGLIPVHGEDALQPEKYGDDRVFVSLELDGDLDEQGEAELADRVDALCRRGHPVVRIQLREEHDIAQEFYRWQFATAVAGAVLAVNPFVQENVESAKVQARRLTDAYEQQGALPDEKPFVEGNTAWLFADDANQKALRRPGDGSVSETLTAHLERIEPNDYFAILAYLDRRAETLEILQSMRSKVAERFGVATAIGFGPRFLHSTGQAYKGGPNTGVFLQITHEDAEDLEAPGRSFSFGVAKSAQARGDFEAMSAEGRRLLRVHFRGKLIAGLQRLDGFVGRAVQRRE